VTPNSWSLGIRSWGFGRATTPPRGLSKLAGGHSGNFSEYAAKMTLASEAELARDVNKQSPFGN